MSTSQESTVESLSRTPHHRHERTAVENRVHIAIKQIEEQKLKSCESLSHFEEAPRSDRFGHGPYLRSNLS